MRKSVFALSIIAAFAFIFMGCPQPPVEDVILESIAITKNPTKTEYEIGEALDTAGLEVTATYSDKSTEVVTGWKTSGFDSSKAAEKQTVTVSYTEDEITKTTSFDVKIKEAPAEEEPEQKPEDTSKEEEKPAEESEKKPEDKTPADNDTGKKQADETTDDDADTVYENLAVPVDDAWRVVLLNTSKSKYKVISHDENSLVIDILEDVNEQIHVEYKFKEIDLTEYKDISYNIKANSTGTMKVGYWTDEDLGSNSASSYSPEGVNSSFPTIKQTDKSGVLYFVTNKAGRYEFSNIAATLYEMPSTSKEGRLSLEAVEGGIKVTVRLLDSDEVPASYWDYNNFRIRERKSGVCLPLDRPSDTQREVSGVYPFVRENERYEFEFELQTASIPWHIEVAGCKAISTVINPDEYFDYDYAPATAKRILNNEGYLSIDKDVKKFFKQEPASSYLFGYTFVGISNPWNAEPICAWYSKLINYDNDNGWIEVDYDSLSTTGFNLRKALKLRLDYGTMTKFKSKDTWFVQGEVRFTVDNCDMEFYIDLISTDDASTDIFKSTSSDDDDNPFAGKSFSYTNQYNKTTAYEFIDNETLFYTDGGMNIQYTYSYNAQTNKLYLNTEKMNLFDSSLITKEEAKTISMQKFENLTEEELKSMGFDSKEEYIQMSLNMYFSNIQLSYEVTGSGCDFTGEIGDVETYLKSALYYDTDISYICTQNGNSYELYGCYLDMGEGKHFITAGKVTDNEITYNPNGDNPAEPSFTVQYVYDSTNDTFTLTSVPGFDSPLVFTANPQTVVTTATPLN